MRLEGCVACSSPIWLLHLLQLWHRDQATHQLQRSTPTQHFSTSMNFAQGVHTHVQHSCFRNRNRNRNSGFGIRDSGEQSVADKADRSIFDWRIAIVKVLTHPFSSRLPIPHRFGFSRNVPRRCARNRFRISRKSSSDRTLKLVGLRELRVSIFRPRISIASTIEVSRSSDWPGT